MNPDHRLQAVRPEDRVTVTYPTRRWRLAPLLLVFAITLAAAAAFMWQFTTGETSGWLGHGVVSVPEIGLPDLPGEAANARSVAPWLKRLREEGCDQAAIRPLAEGLSMAGYPRQAADALVSFHDRCKGPLYLLDDAVETLMSLSEFARAHQLANVLVTQDPAHARYRYLRGRAAEKLERYQESLLDHIDALNLLGDPRHVAGNVFYDVALAHARLGQYCEAMAPVQQWMSYDTLNDTPQTRTIIQEFAEKGGCKNGYAELSEAFSIRHDGDVIIATVHVNRKPGRFIIDTGASLLTLTPEFAKSAGITWKETDRVMAQTANGLSTTYLTRAELVKLGGAEARLVTAGVMTSGALGSDIDGLLGMSFLARFEFALQGDRFVVQKAR